MGRTTYEPGWRWSEHVGPGVGATRCPVEHVGLVLTGTATAAYDDGRVVELRAGDLFHIPPVPHDSWVVGNEPYVSLCADLVEQAPAVDVLVNNVGVFEPKPFEEIIDADWLRFFETNVLSGVRLARAYLPGMRARDCRPLSAGAARA